MKWLDRLAEQSARKIAQRSSRRGLLKGLGALLVGSASIPLLPVARATQPNEGALQDIGDPTSCDYWRYCAIDGFLCSCCGGSVNTCPPGTEMSPITWIGTCRNPVDGRNYVVSYNDCCGKSSCGACMCNREEGDRPVYRPDKANDIDWCLGTRSTIYHCSTALVIGVAIDQK
ncbi:MAG: methylamine dehydrogenase light chain [Gammaproteobacteria bacterium]